MIGPTWNDEFKLPDGSYSVPEIQDYTEYIIKKHETLTKNSLIHVYINRINNRLVFKIKDGYNLELQAPEKNEIIWRYKKINWKSKKKWGKLTSPKVVEVVLVQCNLVDNHYQQKSEVLYTFTPSRS